MNDVKTSAERLRRLYGGESYYTVYGCEPTLHGHQQRDERKILDTALPLWDDTPINEGWLRSVGFVGGNKWPNGFGYMELEAGPNTITVSEPIDGTEEWLVGGERIPHCLMPETRGDVRQVFRKLGITLKEPA